MAITDPSEAAQGGKLPATFISQGVAAPALACVGTEGDRIALDFITTIADATADHHLLFNQADALDLIQRIAGELARARRIDDATS